MFYIYILYSTAHDKFYVGYSSDYLHRLHTHNNTDRNTFTSKYRPWELAAVFEVKGDEADAIKIERFIKRQKSRRFIEKLISTEDLHGSLAQLVRVPHVRD